jgi:hypothetical protein
VFSIAGTAALVCTVMYIGDFGLRIGAEPTTCVYWTPFRQVAMPREWIPGRSIDSLDDDAFWSTEAPCRLLKRIEGSTKP